MGERYDEVMSLCVRRGFLWPAVDLYGGFSGFYDYGHNGAALRRKWEDLWIRYFLGLHDNFCLIDTTTILPEISLKASGHVDHFTDVLVACKRCGENFRGDHLLEDATGESHEGVTPSQVDEGIKSMKIRCPRCKGELGEAKAFNMMFPVGVGPLGRDSAYLRPETAQGVYLNFKREYEALRRKLPLGLAIVGRAYRNEISPRQGAYRMREFLQAELQIFFNPRTFDNEVDLREVQGAELRLTFLKDRGGDRVQSLTPPEAVDAGLPKFYVYYVAKVQSFYLDLLNIPRERFRFYEIGEGERAHYNKLQFDVQVKQDSLKGFKEIAGVHYRTDYDLTGHSKFSRRNLEVSVDGGKFIPHVLELSFGVDRNIWALLDLLYQPGERAILKLPPYLAPTSVGIFPLVNKDGLPEKAEEIHRQLRREFDCEYDDSGSIGKRYARMDEAGTPLCVTIDHQTIKDDSVTLRHRDTQSQDRIPVRDLSSRLRHLLTPSC